MFHFVGVDLEYCSFYTFTKLCERKGKKVIAIAKSKWFADYYNAVNGILSYFLYLLTGAVVLKCLSNTENRQ